MKKQYVIKNIKTGKYYDGSKSLEKCSTTNLFNAELFDEYWVKEVRQKPDEYPMGRNERFVEVKMTEVK